MWDQHPCIGCVFSTSRCWMIPFRLIFSKPVNQDIRAFYTSGVNLTRIPRWHKLKETQLYTNWVSFINKSLHFSGHNLNQRRADEYAKPKRTAQRLVEIDASTRSCFFSFFLLTHLRISLEECLAYTCRIFPCLSQQFSSTLKRSNRILE